MWTTHGFPFGKWSRNGGVSSFHISFACLQKGSHHFPSERGLLTRRFTHFSRCFCGLSPSPPKTIPLSDVLTAFFHDPVALHGPCRTCREPVLGFASRMHHQNGRSSRALRWTCHQQVESTCQWADDLIVPQELCHLEVPSG